MGEKHVIQHFMNSPPVLTCCFHGYQQFIHQKWKTLKTLNSKFEKTAGRCEKLGKKSLDFCRFYVSPGGGRGVFVETPLCSPFSGIREELRGRFLSGFEKPQVKGCFQKKWQVLGMTVEKKRTEEVLEICTDALEGTPA